MESFLEMDEEKNVENGNNRELVKDRSKEAKKLKYSLSKEVLVVSVLEGFHIVFVTSQGVLNFSNARQRSRFSIQVSEYVVDVY